MIDELPGWAGTRRLFGSAALGELALGEVEHVHDGPSQSERPQTETLPPNVDVTSGA
jgi:hypothetical protein